MNKEKLDAIDSISLGFIGLKKAIEDKDNLVIENIIDGFGNSTMGICKNCFGESSKLYKEAQEIYGEVLLGVQTRDYRKAQGAIKLIESFLWKIEIERKK